MKLSLIYLILFFTVLSSCRRKGCTDCNAVNYDKEAKKDDENCEYVHGQFLGVYNVNDSIKDPDNGQYFKNAYAINLTRAECSPTGVLISNYADKNGSSLFSVTAEIDNNTLIIPAQDIDGYSILVTYGYIDKDSISFNIEYTDPQGDLFDGVCYGGR